MEIIISTAQPTLLLLDQPAGSSGTHTHLTTDPLILTDLAALPLDLPPPGLSPLLPPPPDLIPQLSPVATTNTPLRVPPVLEEGTTQNSSEITLSARNHIWSSGSLAEFPSTFVAVSGPRKSGKSTVVGRMLHDLNVTNEIKNVLFQSKKDYRYFIQGPKEVDNPTLSSSCFYEYFTLPWSQRKFGIIDCPSEKHLQHETRNSSMATVVLLILSIDKIPNDFVQHILIHMTYSPQIIIGINKMDTKTYSQEEYEKAVGVIRTALNEIDINTLPPIIPISAINGDNITSKSKAMPWWKGYMDHNNNKYHHILELLEHYVRIPKRVHYSHTRIAIYKEFPKMKVINGYVINGSIRENDSYIVFNNSNPLQKEISFTSIRSNEQTVTTVASGEHFSAALSNFDFVKKGSLLLSKNDTLAIHKQNYIIADITVYSKIKEGSNIFIFSHTTSFDSKIKQIMHKFIQPDNTKIENPREISPKEKARVMLVPSRSFTLDCAVNCKYLGSITGCVSGKVGFIGKIVDINLSNGKFLSTTYKWSRVRLLLLACKDPNSTLPFPKEITLIIAQFLWKLDYKDTILYDDYY